MGVDIFSDGNTSMAHILRYNTHIDPRFPGGGGVLVAQAVRGNPVANRGKPYTVITRF